VKQVILVICKRNVSLGFEVIFQVCVWLW
jgi:hypothetical protein